MLVVETVVRIRREHANGKAIKAIARDLRLSRKVVRKAIRSPEAAFNYQRKVQPLPRIGPYQDRLDVLLEEERSRPDLALEIWQKVRKNADEPSEELVRAEARTRWLGFTDDLEFVLDAPAGVIHFRSASRWGREDMGVNRARMEEIRARWTS